MVKFNSKWKTDDKPNTDIATLKYPYTVRNMDGDEITRLATVEEAEDLLNWYKDHYDHSMITQKLVKATIATQKLMRAAERRAYLEAKAKRDQERAANFEASEAERRAKKESAALARYAARAETEALQMLPLREEILRRALATLREVTAEFHAMEFALTAECMDKIGTAVRALPQATEGVRSAHFNLTTSRAFAFHLRNQTKTPDKSL